MYEMTVKKDYHNAASTGAISEDLFKLEMESIGVAVVTDRQESLEYLRDGKRFGMNEKAIAEEWYEDWKFVNQPEEWSEKYNVVLKSKAGRHSRFHCDGYFPELDTRYELKYSSKDGTTEEKVFYDFVKIQSGAYDDKPLLYIFYGPRADKGIFHLFKAMVDELGKENITVIIDDENLTKAKQHITNTMKGNE